MLASVPECQYSDLFAHKNPLLIVMIGGLFIADASYNLLDTAQKNIL
jgi:hypothetical protein